MAEAALTDGEIPVVAQPGQTGARRRSPPASASLGDGEIEQKIRDDTDALLLSRTRICAGITVLCIFASVVSDVLIGRYVEHELRRWVGVVGALGMTALIALTYRPARLGSPRAVAFVGILAIYAFMFALTLDTGPQAETVAVLAYPLITLGAAILMPWGAWRQAAVVVVAICALQLNLLLLPGNMVILDASLGVALLNGLSLSVFVAHVLEANRISLTRQRYESQRQREVAERQRARAEALADDLDAYAHAVAHDLKNPIGVIMGYNDLLSDERDRLSQDGAALLDATARGCQKMAQIVDELLLLASVRKEGDVARQPLDMSAIVGEARQRLENMIERSNAEVSSPRQWPGAVGHPPWVEEVWVNYISNAIKYGGQPPRIQLGADRIDGDTLHFWVRDNGQGLTGEQRENLFREFSRVAPGVAEGHGLGLSIVKRIVEKLGGQVRVSSRPGLGSTFGFTLPAATRASSGSSSRVQIEVGKETGEGAVGAT